MTAYNFITVIAALALCVLGFLIVANIVIIFARLGHNRAFANEIVRQIAPFAHIFRIGTYYNGTEHY